MMRAVLLVSVLCGACMPVMASSPPRTMPAPAAPGAAAAIAEALLREANDARRRNNAGPLVADDALDRAATEYAKELAALRRLDHKSETPGRETMTARIEAAGGTWMAAGENLASLTGTTATVPRETVQMWLNSPGHRTNLLERKYTHSGIGVAPDHNGYWYIVQLYVLPRRTR